MELNIFLSPEHWLLFIVKINIYIAINDGVDCFHRIYSDVLKVWLTSTWENKWQYSGFMPHLLHAYHWVVVNG